MKNNAKEEMIAQLNTLIGNLISLRTVESDRYNTGHWASHHIYELSNLRNTSFNNEDQCNECLGEGGVYPTHAESIYDGEACPHCHGYGFSSRNKVIDALQNLKNETDKSNPRISSSIEELFNLPLYKKD